MDLFYFCGSLSQKVTNIFPTPAWRFSFFFYNGVQRLDAIRWLVSSSYSQGCQGRVLKFCKLYAKPAPFYRARWQKPWKTLQNCTLTVATTCHDIWTRFLIIPNKISSMKQRCPFPTSSLVNRSFFHVFPIQPICRYIIITNVTTAKKNYV